MFNKLNPLPADPLLGLITAFNNDPRDTKVDLGVGVYRDENGATPIMAAIAEAAKNVMVELCNAISKNQKNSLYKSEFSAISSDKRGKYLWLQDKGLTSLPDGLGKLNLYKAILTGNDLKELPSQILEISSLENLILAVNPINEFPCNLNRLKRLKSISIAETEIKEINCDLSLLDSLDHFD
ncbi:MAG: hypothetical protein VW882_11895, partial [Gammaproteobacteria bacterium]